MTAVQTGLMHLLDDPPRWIRGARLGLLCNPAAIDHHYRHARELIAGRFPDRLVALYAPQHGFFAEKQDNMVESDHMTDPLSGLPVFSLYGKTRRPTAEMLAPIDILLVDLQDVGTRVYTFLSTLSYCMEAAAAHGKRVVVLDRPNPVDGVTLEGNLLRPECASFVGRFPIPMRHGLTTAEAAVLFNTVFGIGAELDVILMRGWRRTMRFDETELPWVPPSPNLPTPASALVYPGQVIWEGTNVSEGRGTTLPFEQFGAPFLDPPTLLAALDTRFTAGAALRPVTFQPTANKWRDVPCHGFHIHVTEPGRFRPYLLSLELLRAIIACHRDQFRWQQPPYEYEFERMPIDLILGDSALRSAIEDGTPVSTLMGRWQRDLDAYVEQHRSVALYPFPG